MDDKHRMAEVDAAQPAVRGGASAIAANLRRAILDGTYAYRERLPAERDLAARFGASRSTVREALRQLEEVGLVSRRVGSGTFVSFRGRPVDSSIAELTSPLELIEVRLAIEPQMASLAVIHASARDLERLTEALAQVEACRDRDAFTRADAHFHQTLAECTRNPLMVWLYEHINDVRGHAQWSAMKDQILTPERIQDYNREHRALVEAIVSRDRDTARQVITAHLDTARRDLVGAGA
jgi:DNA-binding FadR family transcriptional regulator